LLDDFPIGADPRRAAGPWLIADVRESRDVGGVFDLDDRLLPLRLLRLDPFLLARLLERLLALRLWRLGLPRADPRRDDLWLDPRLPLLLASLLPLLLPALDPLFVLNAGARLSES
jgi:hypothetical protein